VNEEIRRVLLELIDAASPFTSGDVVDQTGGTIPLMDRLEDAIDEARATMADEDRESLSARLVEFSGTLPPMLTVDGAPDRCLESHVAYAAI
jgi:hypothetical protein